MSKTLYKSYSLVVLLLLLFAGAAFANLPIKGNGGNEKKSPKGNDSIRTSVSTIPEKEWVIIEVIDEPGKKMNETPVLHIEKKNISQVQVTKIEVRNCQQNNLPEELVPLIQQISQSGNGRKVYMQEENGKTIYFISPVLPEQQQAAPEIDPASLSFPLFWNMKI